MKYYNLKAVSALVKTPHIHKCGFTTSLVYKGFISPLKGSALVKSPYSNYCKCGRPLGGDSHSS